MPVKKTHIFTAGSLDVGEWDIDFHNLMLGDSLRMKAYRKAIFEVIEPGMVVCDLGTGTGILSKWALEAGAAKVYGIEVSEKLMHVAKKELIGFGNKFVPLLGSSYDVQLPEKVDCIISEVLGNIMDNEDCVPILRDAETRFLKKGGQMIPAKVESFLVPIEHIEGHAEISKRRILSTHSDSPLVDKFHQLPLSGLWNFYYDSIIHSSEYLSSPKIISSMGKDWYRELYKEELVFTVNKPGIFTGFKGFFRAQLSNNTILDIESAEEYSTSWKHAYFPIEKVIKLEEEDKITLIFERKGNNRYAWGGISRETKKTL